MRRLAIVGSILVVSGSAIAHMSMEDEFVAPDAFRLSDISVGGATAGRDTPAALSGSRIAAVGDGALVIDPDSGQLVLSDGAGGKIAALAIARDAGLLAYDDLAHVAYIADRRGDQIAVVRVGKVLERVRSWTTPAEPFGIALLPDRRTALVTLVADRLVVAYDVATGAERWRVATAAEPRGIAVAPDGGHAMVASLASGALDELTLTEGRPAVIHRSIPGGDGTLARGAFAVSYLGERLAVTTYQRESPVSSRGSSGRYGGSVLPPIRHHLAFFAAGAPRAVEAEISVHLPRALAWDARRDVLYVAGLGGDLLVQIRNASQVDAHAGVAQSLPAKDRCGVDGLAIAGDGNVLVWCSFTRSVERVRVLDTKGRLAEHWAITPGAALADSTLTPEAHLGMTLFHTADPNISAFGALACANCHVEGRADGVSWLIHGEQLQTPMLAGRIPNTAPYKWDGKAKDLTESLRATLDRLGGDGLSKQHLAALASYLDQLPAARTPTVDRAAVARGKLVFDGAGCANCHDGPALTDQATHRLAKGQATFDTPSLVGIAASAPYFHDGSAATLEVVIRDRGAVHGMSQPARTLNDAEVTDLTAFLRSK